MEVVRAKESDNQRLTEYLAQHKIEGAFDYTVHRTNNFFDQYRLYSDDFETFILQHNGKIEGIASLVFKTMQLNGEKQVIGYARDLRISPTRRAILQWAELFFGAFTEAAAKRGCKYLFSSVERFESQAYNALIRPQRHRRIFPRYYLFWKMFFVSLHALWPDQDKPLKSVQIAPASLKDLEELVAYMRSKQDSRILHSPWTPEKLVKQLARWPDFQISDFLIARDYKGKIVGCVSTWDPSPVQQLQVTGYKGRTSVLQQSLSMASLLRFAHALPVPGEMLKFRCLGHVYFDNPDIFSSLLLTAWHSLERSEFLSYVCYKGDYSARPPRAFISAQMPYGFYSVLTPDMALPDFLRPNPWVPPPDFDLALLL